MTDLDQTPSDGPPAAGAGRAELTEHSRTGMGAACASAIADHLRYSIGRPAAARCVPSTTAPRAGRARSHVGLPGGLDTGLADLGRKVTCYLSAEFLMGLSSATTC